ncbi:MAG TPA: HNH endonuclease [Phycisphaerae bacterium]|nr:HNH endonuclease [Phycisphaerae bacterium]
MKVHPKIIAQIKKVTGKRPLAVINHILEHGQVTTEELKSLYGYNHPPRAARDVREWGIPLDTVRVAGSDGRSIGAYRFGDPDKVENHKLGGRQVFSKAFKELLLARQGPKCAITGEPFHPRYLSIDHRIPYEVAGDAVAAEDDPDSFMLISAAAQRQKSWSCEHCPNWLTTKDASVCRSCYWAAPEHYSHIATEQRRRVELVWVADETKEYEALARAARNNGMSLTDFLKKLARDQLRP